MLQIVFWCHLVNFEILKKFNNHFLFRIPFIFFIKIFILWNIKVFLKATVSLIGVPLVPKSRICNCLVRGVDKLSQPKPAMQNSFPFHTVSLAKLSQPVAASLSDMSLQPIKCCESPITWDHAKNELGQNLSLSLSPSLSPQYR